MTALVKLSKAWKTLYFNKLDETIRVKIKHNFEASSKNSIYFVTEVRIVELLDLAGFSQAHKFNAFLFSGWTAEYTGN